MITEADKQYFITKADHPTEGSFLPHHQLARESTQTHRDLIFHLVFPHLSSQVFITVKKILTHLFFVRHTGIHEKIIEPWTVKVPFCFGPYPFILNYTHTYKKIKFPQVFSRFRCIAQQCLFIIPTVLILKEVNGN